MQSLWLFIFMLFFFGLTKTGFAQSFVPPQIVQIPAGTYIRGSDRGEREAAYQLDEKAYGHSVTRTGKWYEGEFDREIISMPDFSITRNLITNADYALFVNEQKYAPPYVDEKAWKASGLIHPFERTQKFSWQTSTPPRGRALHPVVLVNHKDALAYAAWLSKKTGYIWRLPFEAEWEKSVRGTDGRRFPWGNDFVPENLNSHDQGPFETTPVGQYPSGQSPFGVLDGSGQVYEWTATTAANNRFIVKGGSWDDKGCGVCRPAARHSRPESLKHILIGFRLVCENC